MTLFDASGKQDRGPVVPCVNCNLSDRICILGLGVGDCCCSVRLLPFKAP